MDAVHMISRKAGMLGTRKDTATEDIYRSTSMFCSPRLVLCCGELDTLPRASGRGIVVGTNGETRIR